MAKTFQLFKSPAKLLLIVILKSEKKKRIKTKLHCHFLGSNKLIKNINYRDNVITVQNSL